MLPNQTSGGFTAYDNQNFKRNVIKGDLTKYWGSHTIKTGADYEDISAVVDRFEGGAGQRICNLIEPSTDIYYRHRYYVDDQKAGSAVRSDDLVDPEPARDATTQNAHPARRTATRSSRTCRLTTASAERQHVLPHADAGFALNHNWAPRVGVV